MMNFDSPCMSICELNKAGTHCLGCKRTDQEIFSWMTFSEEKRKQLIVEVKTRQINE